jgi:hypothetical protein
MSKSLTTAIATATMAMAAIYLAPIGLVFAGAGGGCTIAVPEPSALALLAGGVAGILYLHRRKAKK